MKTYVTYECPHCGAALNSGTPKRITARMKKTFNADEIAWMKGKVFRFPPDTKLNCKVCLQISKLDKRGRWRVIGSEPNMRRYDRATRAKRRKEQTA